MKTISTIPTGKMERAGKILKTGLKVGKNYLNYYGEKIIKGEDSRDKLDEKNAADIMASLQELKGSGLKVAQMLSMEQNLLPKAYVDQFSLAQFSVPALSAPLVKKTFIQYFGQSPDALFDSFDYKSTHAASIGQVHEATKDGNKLAVKIQYPGVAASIHSDLAMLKPLASKILRVNMNDAQKYFDEVENKLIEETNYELELAQSIELSTACEDLENIIFPKYYPEYSNRKILTMDWIDGLHLVQFMQTRPSQEVRNTIGQQLWDLYMYQIHRLRKVHADPHPGNILITPEGKIAIIDFGCIKAVPEDFYQPYFGLAIPGTLDDDDQFEALLYELELLYPDDTDAAKVYFKTLFYEVLGLLLIPFTAGSFDFANTQFFAEIAQLGERISREALSSPYRNDRGSTHFLYMNRTFFGIYNLLHLLGATVETSITEDKYLVV